MLRGLQKTVKPHARGESSLKTIVCRVDSFENNRTIKGQMQIFNTDVILDRNYMSNNSLQSQDLQTVILDEIVLKTCMAFQYPKSSSIFKNLNAKPYCWF